MIFLPALCALALCRTEFSVEVVFDKDGEINAKSWEAERCSSKMRKTNRHDSCWLLLEPWTAAQAKTRIQASQSREAAVSAYHGEAHDRKEHTQHQSEKETEEGVINVKKTGRWIWSGKSSERFKQNRMAILFCFCCMQYSALSLFLWNCTNCCACLTGPSALLQPIVSWSESNYVCFYFWRFSQSMQLCGNWNS